MLILFVFSIKWIFTFRTGFCPANERQERFARAERPRLVGVGRVGSNALAFTGIRLIHSPETYGRNWVVELLTSHKNGRQFHEFRKKKKKKTNRRIAERASRKQLLGCWYWGHQVTSVRARRRNRDASLRSAVPGPIVPRCCSAGSSRPPPDRCRTCFGHDISK